MLPAGLPHRTYLDSEVSFFSHSTFGSIFLFDISKLSIRYATLVPIQMNCRWTGSLSTLDFHFDSRSSTMNSLDTDYLFCALFELVPPV